MALIKRIAKSVAIGLSNRSERVWRIAREIHLNTTARHADDCNRYSYPRLRARFIANGECHEFGISTRRDIIRRFEAIDGNASLLTTPTDALFLAEAILNIGAPGDVVECGCFTGGSAAKLSIVAKIVGRRLILFDSFEGLPQTHSDAAQDINLRTSRRPQWTAHRYAADLETVQRNVEQFGEIAPCTFVKGWFSDTLTEGCNLPSALALAFTDVDMASSARECLLAIWPRLSEGGVYFSHDAPFVGVLNALHDRQLWESSLNNFPPLFFGAGFGLCDDSPHLGFFVKDQQNSPEYLKQLMIYK